MSIATITNANTQPDNEPTTTTTITTNTVNHNRTHSITGDNIKSPKQFDELLQMQNFQNANANQQQTNPHSNTHPLENNLIEEETQQTQSNNDGNVNNSEITYPNGNKYIGEIKNGNRNGKGILYLPNGTIGYDGEWKDDEMNGIGKMYDGNGTFEGQFNNGEQIGKGMHIYKDGRKYVGDCKHFLADGYGTLYCNNGNIGYVGKWKDNKMDGKGIMYFFDGKEKIDYDGKWENGAPNGRGIRYWYDGNIRYEGEYNNGKRHGYGMSYNANGKLEFVGQWINDEKVINCCVCM